MKSTGAGIVIGMVLVVFLSLTAVSASTIVYVNTDAINNVPNLSDAQKTQLKDNIVADIQANFDQAVPPPGTISVTRDSAQAGNASRTVTIANNSGFVTDPDGTTHYVYGQWNSGSASSTVNLGMFTDRNGDDYKTGGQWDLDKLANGIGRTAAHEVAHSWSVGHNERPKGGSRPQTKMTDGSLVSGGDRATGDWSFSNFSKWVLKQNLNKRPCSSRTAHDADYINSFYYGLGSIPYDSDDPRRFNAGFEFQGPLANQFNLGWLGEDSDGGLDDGRADFDFIFKSAMEGSTDTDAEVLTFIEGAHDAIQFLLEGQAGTAYEGQWFDMELAQVSLTDPVLRPDGKLVFRQIQISWDLDATFPGPDVEIFLTNSTLFDPYAGTYNGWTLVPEPATCLLLVFGALALPRRRRS